MPVRLRTISYSAWAGVTDVLSSCGEDAEFMQTFGPLPARSYVLHYIEPPGLNFEVINVTLQPLGIGEAAYRSGDMLFELPSPDGTSVWSRTNFPNVAAGYDGVLLDAATSQVRRWPKLRIPLPCAPQLLPEGYIYSNRDWDFIPPYVHGAITGYPGRLFNGRAQFNSAQYPNAEITSLGGPPIGTLSAAYNYFIYKVLPEDAWQCTNSAPPSSVSEAYCLGSFGGTNQRGSNHIRSRALNDISRDVYYLGPDGRKLPLTWIKNPADLGGILDSGISRFVYSNRDRSYYRLGSPSNDAWINRGLIYGFKSDGVDTYYGYAEGNTWAVEGASAEQLMFDGRGAADLSMHGWEVICTHVAARGWAGCVPSGPSPFQTEVHLLCAPGFLLSSHDYMTGDSAHTSLRPPDMALDVSDTIFGDFRLIWTPQKFNSDDHVRLGLYVADDFSGVDQVVMNPMYCRRTTDTEGPPLYTRNREFRHKKEAVTRWSYESSFISDGSPPCYVGPSLDVTALDGLGLSASFNDGCGTVFPPEQAPPWEFVDPADYGEDWCDGGPGDACKWESIDYDCVENLWDECMADNCDWWCGDSENCMTDCDSWCSTEEECNDCYAGCPCEWPLDCPCSYTGECFGACYECQQQCDDRWTEFEEECTTFQCCTWPRYYIVDSGITGWSAEQPAWELPFSNFARIPFAIYNRGDTSKKHILIHPWRRLWGDVSYSCYFAINAASLPLTSNVIGKATTRDSVVGYVESASPVATLQGTCNPFPSSPSFTLNKYKRTWSLPDCLPAPAYLYGMAEYITRSPVPRTFWPRYIAELNGAQNLRLAISFTDTYSGLEVAYNGVLEFEGDPLAHAVIWPFDIRAWGIAEADEDCAWTDHAGWLPPDLAPDTYELPTFTQAGPTTAAADSDGKIVITTPVLTATGTWAAGNGGVGYVQHKINTSLKGESAPRTMLDGNNYLMSYDFMWHKTSVAQGTIAGLATPPVLDVPSYQFSIGNVKHREADPVVMSLEVRTWFMLNKHKDAQYWTLEDPAPIYIWTYGTSEDDRPLYGEWAYQPLADYFARSDPVVETIDVTIPAQP